jgi:argininosuccinate lyase
MAGMVADLEPVPERLRAAAGAGFSTATDLADWLVRSLDMPFRDAHHVTGRLVAEAESRGCALEDLPLEAMRQVEPRIDDAVYEVLGVENSVRSRKSFGGTAPERVLEQVAWWRERV